MMEVNYLYIYIYGTPFPKTHKVSQTKSFFVFFFGGGGSTYNILCVYMYISIYVFISPLATSFLSFSQLGVALFDGTAFWVDLKGNQREPIQCLGHPV